MIEVVTIVVVGILLALAFLLLKLEHHGRKIKVVVIILVAVILFLSVSSVFTSSEFDLRSPRGIVNAVYLYAGWLGRTAVGLWDVATETVRMTGNVVKFNVTESG